MERVVFRLDCGMKLKQNLYGFVHKWTEKNSGQFIVSSFRQVSIYYQVTHKEVASMLFSVRTQNNLETMKIQK